MVFSSSSLCAACKKLRDLTTVDRAVLVAFVASIGNLLQGWDNASIAGEETLSLHCFSHCVCGPSHDVVCLNLFIGFFEIYLIDKKHICHIDTHLKWRVRHTCLRNSISFVCMCQLLLYFYVMYSIDAHVFLLPNLDFFY